MEKKTRNLKEKRTKLITKQKKKYVKTCLSFVGSNEKFQRHRFSKNSLIKYLRMFPILSIAQKKYANNTLLTRLLNSSTGSGNSATSKKKNEQKHKRRQNH